MPQAIQQEVNCVIGRDYPKPIVDHAAARQAALAAYAQAREPIHKEVKKMTSISMEQYLTQVHIPLRLSCITPTGWPVVLSLWYLYEDGDLFCATTEKARVVTYLKANPRCAFEVAADQPPYCGLRGRASATIVPERGIEILERLLDRYVGGTNNKLARILLARTEAEVAIRLTPQSYHTWNFNQRMADLFPDGVQKHCPE